MPDTLLRLAACTVAAASLLILAGLPPPAAAGPQNPRGPAATRSQPAQIRSEPAAPLSQTGAARPVEQADERSDHVFRLPVDGGVLLARFVRPAHRWSAGHRGVDLAAGVTDPVHAPAAGVVAFSGTVVDRGVVTLEHADGLRSSLEPVLGTVAVGTPVAAGDVVGTLAAAGSHCEAGCLHWGVRRGQEYLDPLDLLPGGGPVVLLPEP